MTDVPVLAVASMALLLAVLAAWLVQPRPQALVAEPGFKWLLGQLVRADAGEQAWRDAVRRTVVFHPVGRFADLKVSVPAERGVQGTPLPGEAAFVAQLAAIADEGERWRLLKGDAAAFVDDEAALPEPSRLPRWLGPSWRRDGVADGALRRLGATLVAVRGRPVDGVPDVTDGVAVVVATSEVPLGLAAGCAIGVLASASRLVAENPWLAAALGELAARALQILHQEHTEGLAAAITARAPEGRVLLLATGEGGPLLLRALVHDVPLRDRVVGVCGVGAGFGGWPGRDGPLSEAACADWNEAWFRHEHLDVEVMRLVPYAALGWMRVSERPPGVGGLPVASQRLPAARFVGQGGFLEPMEPPSLHVMDLGVLDPDAAPPAALIRDAIVAWMGVAALAGGA